MKTLTKVFFDPGYLPMDDLVKLTRNHACLKLIRHRKRDQASYRENKLEVQIYPDYKKEKLGKVLSNDIAQVWSNIINDHQTSVLFDRTGKSSSDVFKFNELLLMCCAYQHWLETEKPDFLLYTATPHNIKTWVLSRVAESIGIPVLYFQSSFFPWRQFLMEGLMRDARIIPPPPPLTAEAAAKDWKFYSEYMDRKRGSREEAMPIYEIERLKENNWKLLKPKAEFKYFLRKPLSAIEKIKSYIDYEKTSRDFSGIKYAAFFLHYQPERSTIPEGYGFGLQLAAILALRQALPDDTWLVVREHPSTYTYNFSKNYRNREFYEQIASIDRVIISSLAADPYRIIDNSIATASITGTVIGEALVRGKPSIAFGAGIMQAVDSPQFHRYRSIEDLRAFLASLDTLDKDDPEKHFASVLAASFSGIDAGDTHYAESQRMKYLCVSVINCINQLLAGAVKSDLRR